MPADALLAASRFRVTIGDEVVGLCRVLGVALSGEVAPPVVRIERALSSSRVLFDWCRFVLDGRDDDRDVVVHQLDATGERVVLGLHLAAARPVAWHAPRWDTEAGGVAIEALELRYQRLSWLPREPSATAPGPGPR
ncbi:MAG: phage tail protein [Nannocystaceae bacterium]